MNVFLYQDHFLYAWLLHHSCCVPIDKYCVIKAFKICYFINSLNIFIPLYYIYLFNHGKPLTSTEATKYVKYKSR